jgi:hypothetical protein
VELILKDGTRKLWCEACGKRHASRKVLAHLIVIGKSGRRRHPMTERAPCAAVYITVYVIHNPPICESVWAPPIHLMCESVFCRFDSKTPNFLDHPK